MTRMWTITDVACGTTRTCDQTINIDDTTFPVITTCPQTRNIEGCDENAITGPVYSTTLANSDYAEFNDATNAGVASDVCGIVNVQYQDAAAGTCPVVVSRTWYVTDACGNTTSCTQTINVDDTTPPAMVLNGPNPIELCQGAVYVDPGVTATDVCSGDVTGTVTTMGFVDINTLGDYVVTYTATDDCGNTATISRTFSVNPGFTVSGDVTNVLCHGNSTGAIDLTVTGGALPLVFNWGGPAVVVANEDQINLPAGTFLVTVTDANGCAVEEEFGITEPTELQVSMSGFLPETCAGANDGSAIATASGGVGPYEFKWSNLFMQTHPSASTAMNLAPDNYWVTVTDANGCSKVEGFVISGPTQLIAEIISHTDETCPGAFNGSATVNATGGTTGYTYEWSNGDLTAAASFLTDDTYTVTVTDANNCTATAEVTIGTGQSVPDMALTASGPASATCGETIAVQIKADQFTNLGTLQFSVNWNNAQLQLIGNTSLTIDGDAPTIGTPMPDQLTYSWFDADFAPYGAGVANGTTILTLNFKVLTNMASGVTVNITGAPTPISATTGNFCAVNVATLNEVDFDVDQIAVTCPADITTCLESASFTLPDGVPADGTFSGTGVTGDQFDPAVATAGVHVITYTGTDVNGCSNTCTFTVTVIDLELNAPANVGPVCPGATVPAILLSATPNDPATSYSWSVSPAGSGLAAGNSSGLNASIPAFTAGAEGTYTVTVTATLGACTDTEEFTITIDDAGGLNWVNCPADIVVNNDVDKCCANVNWTTPTALDNCDNAVVSGPTGGTSGTCFDVTAPGAPHMISYTATDGNGNTITCSFTITVRDMQLPDLDCPQDRTVEVDANCDYTGTAVLNPVATDNCAFTLVNDVNNTNTLVGEIFGLGDHTILWTATDGFPNTTTCSFTLTVVDNTAPTIDCPADIVVNNDPGICGAVVSFNDPVVDDNCTINLAPGMETFVYTGAVQPWVVPAGVTSITVDVYGAEGYGAEGLGGRVQATHPVIPGETLYLYVGGAGTETTGGFNGGGSGGVYFGYGSGGGASDIRQGGNTLNDRIIVAGGGGGAGSNCGLNSAEGGHGGGLIGGSGCVFSCSNCQYTGSGGTQVGGGIAGPTGHGSCGGNQNGSLGFGGSNTLIGYGTGGGGGYYGGGSGCFEGAGGGSSYTSGLASGVTHSQGVRLGNGQITISYASQTVALLEGLPTNSVFPVGSTTNVFVISDASGNTASCSFNVTVTDNENPQVSCAGLTTAINTSDGGTGDCQGEYSWNIPNPSDNCGVINYSVTYTNPDGTIDGPADALAFTPQNTAANGTPVATRNFAVGQTTVTYYVEDAAGHTNTCAFTVTVTDNENPTIANCPANPTAICGAGPVWWIPPTADDNCGVISFTASHNPGDIFPVGNTVVTYLATDAAGLTAECTFTVTVHPVPTVTATVNDVDCHGESTGSIDITPSGGTPPYTYNWTGPDVSQFLQDQTNLPAGTFHVTVTDVNGCTVAATYGITEPTEVDIFLFSQVNVLCNGNATGSATVRALDGTPPYQVAWLGPTPGNPAGIEIAASGGNYTLTNLLAGNYTIRVTDANGCTAVTNADISEPTELVATTISTTDESCDGNNDGAATVNATGGTTPYTYNWGGVGNTPTAASNSGLADGTYTVTVTDANLCTATTTVTIGQGIVLEINELANIGPVCPEIGVDQILLSSIPNNPAIEYSWAGGLPAGLPNGTSTGLNPAIPAFTSGANEGTWTVTVTATLGLCSDTEEFEITIDDDGGLHWVNCPADIVVSNDIDKCSARVNWTPPTAIDDCTPPNEVGVTQTLGDTPGSLFSVNGSPHLIRYEATDGNGNTITCTFRIRVRDVQEPDAICKDITVMLDGAGTASIGVSDVNNNSSDNCPGMTLGIDNGSFDCDDLGANIVILTATDAADNTASCMAVVTVVDKIAPTISCPDPLTAVCAAGENPVYDSWATFTSATGSGDDNCAINPASFLLESEVDNGLSCPRTITRTYRVADYSGNTATCTQTITVDDTEAPVFTGAPVAKTCGTLAAGDIAFVAFQSDDPDQFAIVTLAPLAAGTVINFTDNGWESNDNTFRTGEGVIAWTVPVGGLAAGTVVTFNPGALTATSGTLASVDGSFALSTSGDQVIAFCGTYNTLTGAISGANLAAVDFDDPFGWDANATSSNNSALPLGLTNGSTAISVGEADNGRFECPGPPNGSPAAVAAIVNTASNWAVSASPFTPAVAVCTYTITGGAGSLPQAVVNVSCSEDVPALPTVTATDNCTDPINVYLNEVLQPGVCDNKFTLTRTWIATDACGNSTVHTQTINVNDNTAPVITGTPNNLTVECDGSGNSNQLIDWLNDHGGFSATDNCGELTWSHNFGALSNDCGETGTTTVMFTATDACGNTATRTATFTIQDTQDPFWVLNPQDLIIECDNTSDPNDQIAAWLNTAGGGEAGDNCSNVRYSNNFTSLSDGCGTTGTALVTFTARDACGRTTTRTATVTVVDTHGPAITSPAKNQTVECDGNGNTTALNAWLANNGGATASDECGTITWETPVLMNEIEGCGNAKELVYMFQAKDACNNLSATTIASFIIEDTEAPEWTAYPQNASAECGDAPMAIMDWLANFGGGQVEDVCGGASGSVTVHYTDEATFLADAVIDGTEGFESINGISNNYVLPGLTVSSTPGTMEPYTNFAVIAGAKSLRGDGSQKYTFTFPSDINTFGITIRGFADFQGAGAQMTFMNNAGDAFTIATGPLPDLNTIFLGIVNSAMAFNTVMIETTTGANDVVLMDQLHYGLGPIAGSFVYETDLIKYTPACGNSGVYEYRFTAKDLCGNDTSWVASFTVVDNPPPSLTAPANLTLSCTQDQQNNSAAIIDWLDNYTAADECGTVDVTHNFSATTVDYCTGDDITVTWTATDECGNTSTTGCNRDQQGRHTACDYASGKFDTKLRSGSTKQRCGHYRLVG
ncbi:MAG: HYR domain-containing protein [Lewinellaceae bacterium]|nr:HYR domain-containing protein [Lewinellaceae bacterium]